ncbi:septum formation initiator family protein [Mesonia sediminis]|uniref:Septum formation initiator family protein n=1 Tax=Mesonia sediminis TaxID=1703946 RepID=A0ABW5SDQ4_9FLAO
MRLKALFQNPWFKFLSNKYVLLLLLFGIWMLFLDSNSWLVHQELNEEIHELEENKAFYVEEIKKDTSILRKLAKPEELERFARETYFMKKENEEVYIIEYKTKHEQE